MPSLQGAEQPVVAESDKGRLAARQSRPWKPTMEDAVALKRGVAALPIVAQLGWPGNGLLLVVSV